MGDFKKAKGVIPWKEGDPLPEDVIQGARGNYEPLFLHYQKQAVDLSKQLAEAQDGLKNATARLKSIDAALDELGAEKIYTLESRVRSFVGDLKAELKEAQKRIAEWETLMSVWKEE